VFIEFQFHLSKMAVRCSKLILAALACNYVAVSAVSLRMNQDPGLKTELRYHRDKDPFRCHRDKRQIRKMADQREGLENGEVAGGRTRKETKQQTKQQKEQAANVNEKLKNINKLKKEHKKWEKDQKQLEKDRKNLEKQQKLKHNVLRKSKTGKTSHTTCLDEQDGEDESYNKHDSIFGSDAEEEQEHQYSGERPMEHAQMMQGSFNHLKRMEDQPFEENEDSREKIFRCEETKTEEVAPVVKETKTDIKMDRESDGEDHREDQKVNEGEEMKEDRGENEELDLDAKPSDEVIDLYLMEIDDLRRAEMDQTNQEDLPLQKMQKMEEKQENCVHSNSIFKSMFGTNPHQELIQQELIQQELIQQKHGEEFSIFSGQPQILQTDFNSQSRPFVPAARAANLNTDFNQPFVPAQQSFPKTDFARSPEMSLGKQVLKQMSSLTLEEKKNPELPIAKEKWVKDLKDGKHEIPIIDMDAILEDNKDADTFPSKQTSQNREWWAALN
jgi:hypothetical protein